ncbi:hypothetical protein OS190_07325 [Sulfitobacter sp. F26204]|uniref:hypothetical protein n=1 Tax=Sulfitobacter sp. F26204 TaxID=2996014 RepID=UPI00225E5B23|nr:hypothetical protein [Sulfitobacter sp. F26204]MCX7559378.1 hypothetical protein [Sulfitobacter sp. F26204]
MNPDFTFAHSGRNRRTAMVVAAIWFAVLAAGLFWEMSALMMAFLLAFTLPALWDLMRDPASGLTLTNNTLHWYSGKRQVSVALEEVAMIRLDTRLDLSVKVTLILNTGTKLRLPFESTPPHQPFEEALIQRGLKTERHHFQLMQ